MPSARRARCRAGKASFHRPAQIAPAETAPGTISAQHRHTCHCTNDTTAPARAGFGYAASRLAGRAPGKQRLARTPPIAPRRQPDRTG